MAEVQRIRFTDEVLDGAFLPEEGKRISLYDDKVVGLALRITSKGAKTFVFCYKKNRKAERVLIGPWPGTKLVDARKQAHDHAGDVLHGKNPAQEKREKRERMKSDDRVEAIMEEWFARHVRKLRSGWPNAEYILKKDVLPVWKNKHISEISRADVLRLVDRIVDRGAPVGANRALTIINAWLGWCVQRGILSVNPASGVKKPTIEKTRDRVLTESELSEILAVLNTMEYPSGPFVRLLLMTAQRRGEVANMKWSDIDMDKAMWTLPKEATKAGRIHDVPLSTEAIALLKGLPRFKKGDYVFTTTKGKLAINGFSKMKVGIDTAIARRRKEAGVKEAIPEWTLHDGRRTAATKMAEVSVPPHVLASILNHAPSSSQGITAVYNRFRYVEERRAALQAWSDRLAALTPAEAAKRKRKAGR